MCVDPESIELLADGELPEATQYFVHAHLATCAQCAAALERAQGDRQWLRSAFGAEDEAHADAARAAVARVEANLARRRPSDSRRWRRWRWLRLAAAIFLCTAGILTSHRGSGPATVVSAAPGVIIDAAYVRERAWIEQRGKVLHWQVDADISGSPALPDDHYRTLHWVSNVAGAEGSVYRKFNGGGELVTARWMRADGSYVTYRRGAADELVIHPAAAVIRAEVAALPLPAQLVVERYLAQRDRDAPEAQRQRAAEWFVRIARAEDDATLQMIRTEDGREAYYIQQDFHPAPKGLKQLVVQTYIESEGYRRYRLKTTRQRLDGSYHLEDARWSGFTESTPNDFARHTLTDLLQQQSPVVMNAARIAGTDAGK